MTRGLKGVEQKTLIKTFAILNKLSYQVWVSHLRSRLEGLELWDVIELDNIARKKD